MKTFRLSLAFVALAAAGSSLLAQVPEPVITAATGFDYSRGDYGFPTDTEVFSVPLDLGYESGPWTWRANLSHLTIKGPAAIVGSGAAARPTTSSESGVGDIYLSSTCRSGPILGRFSLEPTVRVKLPTASESRGLGTGETDFYGQLDSYATFGAVTPFATLGYRVLGDNTTYQLNDGIYASGGAHFRTNPATVITMAVNWSQRLVAGGANPNDAMIAVTHDASERWRAMGYATKGFSTGSPDFGGGARLTYRF